MYSFQEKQAKRKVTRADEEKRLAQKKKEEEERRQREIGRYSNPHFSLLCINLEAWSSVLKFFRGEKTTWCRREKEVGIFFYL